MTTDLSPEETNDDPEALPASHKPSLNLDGKKTNPAASVISMLLFAVVGYFVWKSNIRVAVIITVVILIHELGHLLAMKAFHYSNLNILFIPFLGGVASGSKRKVSQRQEVSVLLLGPLPGIIIGIVLFFLWKEYRPNNWLYGSAYAFVIVNLFNLIPVFPLDGGRMLKSMFLGSGYLAGSIFMLISVGLICYFIFTHELYWLLIFALSMLMSMSITSQAEKVRKQLLSEGFNLKKSYEELSDEDYNLVRYRMIEHMAIFKKYDLHEFDPLDKREIALAKRMDNLFLNFPTKDMNIIQKLIVILIWIVCFVAPFLVGMKIPFLVNN